MTTLKLEDPRVKDSKICELFGLSNSGKSTYVKDLLSGKYNISTPSEGRHLIKFALFFKFFFKHPLKTAYLFYKILIMRNSYMLAVLARYEEIKDRNILIYSDEFFLQSIFMIFQNKSDKKQIAKIMNIFPKSKSFVLIEIDQKTRYKRLNKNGFPGQKIDREYAEVWMKNSEFNYNIVKEILLNRCKIILD